MTESIGVSFESLSPEERGACEEIGRLMVLTAQKAFELALDLQQSEGGGTKEAIQTILEDTKKECGIWELAVVVV